MTKIIRILLIISVVFVMGLSACTSNDEPVVISLKSNGIETNAGSNGIITDSSQQYTEPNSRPEANGQPLTTMSAMSLSESIADIVARVKPAVVFITSEAVSGGFFRQEVTRTTSGSGIILSDEGYILTNFHVIQNAKNIKVALPQRATTYKGEIIGTDPLTDLAVLKIEAENLEPASFGDAQKLRPGNLVIAMGNPLGLTGGPTITLGIVSNTERSFTFDDATFYDVIQTDAAINPGNSGGPLVDLDGNVVGISTILAGGAQNIGFAIGSGTAERVYKALIGENQRVIRPWLGITLKTVTPDFASSEGLSLSAGVMVSSVENGSPSNKAGLEVNDIITHFNDEEVFEATQLIKALWKHQIGDDVRLLFQRGKTKMEVVINLSTERPQ